MANIKGEHAYGLDHRLFTSKGEQQEKRENFERKLKDIDYMTKMNLKKLESEKTVLINSKKPIPPTVYRKIHETTMEEVRWVVEKIKKKHDRLRIRIAEVSERSKFIDMIYEQLEDLCNKVTIKTVDGLVTIEHHPPEGYKKKQKGAQDDDVEHEVEVKPPDLIKYRQDIENER